MFTKNHLINVHVWFENGLSKQFKRIKYSHFSLNKYYFMSIVAKTSDYMYDVLLIFLVM